MPIETTLSQAEFGLSAPRTANGALPSSWSLWSLGKLVLTGLLLMYLVAWGYDFRRISRLEAEPTPASKIITISKYEAWERIYSRPERWIREPAAAPTRRAP
jgi:hypothetical protein